MYNTVLQTLLVMKPPPPRFNADEAVCRMSSSMFRAAPKTRLAVSGRMPPCLLPPCLLVSVGLLPSRHCPSCTTTATIPRMPSTSRRLVQPRPSTPEEEAQISRGERAMPGSAWPSRRRSIAVITGLLVGLVTDANRQAAAVEHRSSRGPGANQVHVPSVMLLLPLDVYLGVIRSAQQELNSIKTKVLLAESTGAALPFADLQRSLRTGELAGLRDASVAADKYLVEDDLQDWEEEAWNSMPTSAEMWRNDGGTEGPLAPFAMRAPSGVNTFNLKSVERPNEFLCLVLSCFNDPRQPPSTNHLLTLKMLQEGMSMGARGSRKVTPKGITAIIDDLNDKLDSYLALAAERQRRLGPRTAS